MRLFALLLSLYLTCLSCMPCADDVAACAKQAQAGIATVSQSDCGHGDLGDWCSPLCQCRCCAGAVLAPIKPVHVAPGTPGQRAAGPRHALLLVAAPRSALGAVWQPPQA